MNLKFKDPIWAKKRKAPKAAEAAAEEGEDELRQDKGAETQIPMALLPSSFWAASSWEA